MEYTPTLHQTTEKFGLTEIIHSDSPTPDVPPIKTHSLTKIPDKKSRKLDSVENLIIKNFENNLKSKDFIMIYINNKDPSKKSCIANLLDYLGKKLSKYKTIAYLSNRPWLMTTTIKKNILLNKKLEKERLNKILEFSSLNQDLKLIKDRLEKRVGEGGDALNLSQKTKVGLAQCMYQNCDVYLFNDIMSCFDTATGDFVMENSLAKYLKDKTRILITTSVSHLGYADYIYFVENNSVALQGGFEAVKNSGMYLENKKLEEELALQTRRPDTVKGAGIDSHGKRESRQDRLFPRVGTMDLENSSLDSQNDSSSSMAPVDDFSLKKRGGEEVVKKGKNKLFRSLLGGSKKNDMLYPDWIHDTANIHENADKESLEPDVDFHDHEYEANKFINELFCEEDINRSVACKIYIGFTKKAFGGVGLILLIYLVTQYASLAEWYSYLFIIEWSYRFHQEEYWKNLGAFALISSSFTIACLVRNSVFMICGLKLSKKLFSMMLYYFLHSKIDDFADRVSATIILNRFTKDLERIDRSKIFL
jgi:ABC-type multidrug transport system ATPase subunit